MRRFVIYRPNPPAHYVAQGYALPADQVQLEGIVFTDGSCVVHWMTATHSTSIFESFEAFMKVHGHPEYGTEVDWLDVEIPELKVQGIEVRGSAK